MRKQTGFQRCAQIQQSGGNQGGDDGSKRADGHSSGNLSPVLLQSIEMLVERYCKSDRSRLKQQCNETAALVICLIRRAGQKQNDDNHRRYDEQRGEVDLRELFIHFFGQQIDGYGEQETQQGCHRVYSPFSW